MPTYGYKCVPCDAEFDVVQKLNDDPVSECPTCGGPVKRVFHPVGIIFKGSGFYTTDYKRRPAPDKAKTDGADKAKTDGAKTKENGGGKKPAPEKATT